MSATITTEFLMICHYCCLCLIAGADEFSDEDAAQITAKAEAMTDHYRHAVIVLDTDESPEFSAARCDTCTDDTPGDRYRAEAVTD